MMPPMTPERRFLSGNELLGECIYKKLKDFYDTYLTDIMEACKICLTSHLFAVKLMYCFICLWQFHCYRVSFPRANIVGAVKWLIIYCIVGFANCTWLSEITLTVSS